MLTNRSRPVVAAAAAGIAVRVLTASNSALACGPDTRCTIGDRHYHIRMPSGHAGRSKIGAIVYAHGYRGTAQAVMRNKWFKRLGDRLGVAFIAPKSSGKDWSLPGSPSRMRGEPPVDELAFFDRLLDDATKRFPIDRARILMTGFSAGGMMVWNLACHRSQSFAGFAPIAGTFWRPLPATCSSPVASIIHLHGDRDTVVPLDGRPIGPTHQGEVPKALAMYARYGAFGPPRKTERGDLRCQERRNAQGQRLEFCLFSGGHTFNSDYIGRAWQALVAGEVDNKADASR